MKKILILLLCLTGVALAQQEPRSFNVLPGPRNLTENEQNKEKGIKRFACPVGFFRLKRFCYYLSGGKAPWHEAYFHCKDRNATLSILDRYGKDKMLRKYLMGDQFMKLERWIGGIYNHKQKIWTWSTSGKPLDFQSFDKKPENPMPFSCIIMDPNTKYKWKSKSCFENKHYVCEVPVGGINRRRKKTTDSLAPQNLRLKVREKGKKNPDRKNKKEKRRRNKGENAAWKRERMQQNPNQEWSQGVQLGSRPPSRIRMAPGAMPSDRKRHYPIDKKHPGSVIPSVSQISDQSKEYGAFLGDSPVNSNRQQSLVEFNNALSDFQEQVLLKS